MSNIYDTDPTREATCRPRLPMTPAQLDALRPKPASEQPAGSEAKRIAYQAGVTALEPLILRVEELERRVLQLQNDFLELKYPQPHLRGVEKRKV
jgi:hypothetical protein